ncbi:hypothetical protein HBZS_121560 [Helicobacter bizzozeronii CCUG 35545]|nr:hypothetical protein HBZS_121560 [Helicobacter bizzozeronii CCUG 35545]
MLCGSPNEALEGLQLAQKNPKCPQLSGQNKLNGTFICALPSALYCV